MSEIAVRKPRPDFKLELQRADLSENTRGMYTADLVRFEAWLGTRQLGPTIIEEYVADLRTTYADRSVNRHIAAVRWWCRRLADLALEDGNFEVHTLALAAAGKRIRSTIDTAPVGRHIPQAEFDRLIELCESDPTPRGLRDRAMLGIAWFTGARVGGLARLSHSDLEWLSDLQSLWVTLPRKGRGTYRVFVNGGAAQALRDYVDTLPDAEPGDPLWWACRKNGLLRKPGITPRALIKRLHVLTEAADLPTTNWHDFRRTVAGDLIAAGDVSLAGEQLGHRDKGMTLSYDRRGAEAQAELVRSARFMPYNQMGVE